MVRERPRLLDDDDNRHTRCAKEEGWMGGRLCSCILRGRVANLSLSSLQVELNLEKKSC